MTMLFAMITPFPALLAYVGPGPGLTMMAALIGMLATLGIALWTVAIWPLRAMFRKRREARVQAAVTEADQCGDQC